MSAVPVAIIKPRWRESTEVTSGLVKTTALLCAETEVICGAVRKPVCAG